MQARSRVRTDATVQEGGTIQVRVDGETAELLFVVPSVGAIRVPVVRGRAEYTLPPSVRGGTRVIISDLRVPDPSSVGVDVVGGSSR